MEQTFLGNLPPEQANGIVIALQKRAEQGNETALACLACVKSNNQALGNLMVKLANQDPKFKELKSVRAFLALYRRMHPEGENKNTMEQSNNKVQAEPTQSAKITKEEVAQTVLASCQRSAQMGRLSEAQRNSAIKQFPQLKEELEKLPIMQAIQHQATNRSWEQLLSNIGKWMGLEEPADQGHGACQVCGGETIKYEYPLCPNHYAEFCRDWANEKPQGREPGWKVLDNILQEMDTKLENYNPVEETREWVSLPDVPPTWITDAKAAVKEAADAVEEVMKSNNIPLPELP